MPERFAEASLTQAAESISDPARRLAADQSLARAALASPQLLFSVTDGSAAGSILGCQYLLGFIPFTRLYLQHGAAHLVEESVADYALSAGLTGVIARGASAAAASRLLSPRIEALAAIDGPSVNAYDLFFFRYLKVSGGLKLRFRRADGEISESSAEIDQSEFRAFGHAPALARLLERGVDQAAAKVIQSADSPLGRSRPALELQGSEQLILILPPRIETRAAAVLGPLLSASYGFSGSVPLNAAQIGRVIQSGIASGAELAGTAAAQLVFSYARPRHAPAAAAGRFAAEPSIWFMSADLMAAEAADDGQAAAGLKLDLQLSLYSMRGGILQLAYSKPARIFEPLAQSADGAWVVTLENGLANAAGGFLDSNSGMNSE